MARYSRKRSIVGPNSRFAKRRRVSIPRGVGSGGTGRSRGRTYSNMAVSKRMSDVKHLTTSDSVIDRSSGAFRMDYIGQQYPAAFFTSGAISELDQYMKKTLVNQDFGAQLTGSTLFSPLQMAGNTTLNADVFGKFRMMTTNSIRFKSASPLKIFVDLYEAYPRVPIGTNVNVIDDWNTALLFESQYITPAGGVIAGQSGLSVFNGLKPQDCEGLRAKWDIKHVRHVRLNIGDDFVHTFAHAPRTYDRQRIAVLKEQETNFGIGQIPGLTTQIFLVIRGDLVYDTTDTNYDDVNTGIGTLDWIRTTTHHYIWKPFERKAHLQVGDYCPTFGSALAVDFHDASIAETSTVNPT